MALQAEVTRFTEGCWILKSIDPIIDNYRKYIVTCMRDPSMRQFTKEKLERMVLEQLRLDTTTTLTEVPTAILSRVLAELAEYHSGERLWHLKSGLRQLNPVPMTR